MITKRNRPKIFGVYNGTEFAVAFKKFCAAEGIQVYSIMSETKAAFAQSTIRSLNNIFYRYIEDFAYKFIHKLPQFINTKNSRRNSSIDMRPNTVRNCDFMFILYSKPLREYKKPTFKSGHRVRISKYDTVIERILSCSRIKFSNSLTIILDGVDTGVLFSDFTLHLRRKHVDVADIYFTLLNAAGI